MSRFLIGFAIIFACLYSKIVGAPSFEIHVGNCYRAVVADRVFFEHVHLRRIPFVYRSHDCKWHGDETIYCIIAESLKPLSKGSTAQITDGGFGQHFATIHLKSSRGHGLEYNVTIYGSRSHY